MQIAQLGRELGSHPYMEISIGMFLQKNKPAASTTDMADQNPHTGLVERNEASSMGSAANNLLEFRRFAIQHGHNYLGRIIEPVVRETLEIAHKLEQKYEKYELVDEFQLRQARSAKTADLSPLQLECLKWCSLGKTDKEIALELSTQESTVLREMKAIRQQLNTSSDAHSVAKAIRIKLI